MSSRERIEQTLASLRRSWQRAENLEKSAYLVAALLVAVGIAVGVAQLGAVKAALTLLIGAFVLALVVAGVYLARSAAAAAHRQMAMARLAEELAPELGTAPTSAVDLARRLERPDGDFSQELAHAHLDATAEALAGAALDERLRQARRRQQQRTMYVVGGAAAFMVLMLTTMSAGRSRLATWLRDPTAARISSVPLAGDIRLTYRYPAYTGLGSRVVEGGDGSIAAVVGTQVELEAVADTDARSAVLRVVDAQGQPSQDVPMSVDGRKLRATLAVLRDGRYTFELVDEDGERVKDGNEHPIRATLDASPEVAMDQPATDVELKDDRHVDVLWRASDDFGVGDVNLVVEQPGKEAVRIGLASGAQQMEQRREGEYRWSVAELSLAPGAEVRFYVEAVDNDVIGGPKRAVSATRRLVIFSAKQRHSELLERQRLIMNGMVDLLAEELVHPFPRELDVDVGPARDKQRAILERMARLGTEIDDLVKELRDDKLSGPEIVAAFSNIGEHIDKAERERTQSLQRLANASTSASRKSLADRQAAAITQLEKDIIYLDDLLAIQRISELKETARDLLASQRELQDLLQQYKETKDPALKAELQKRIAELKEQMMQLLARMADIKQGLTGEYRNLESASMLQLDDQLERLDQMLRDGDLDKAAAELEQLANMVENMVNGINEAEQEYGGERYSAVREQLEEFAQEFRELETEQKDLAEKNDQLLKEYRKKAVERAGRNMDELVEKAREKTQEALRELDNVAEAAPFMYSEFKNQLETARQRLLDLDSLLEQRDFAEARQVGDQAQAAGQNLQMQLNDRLPPATRDSRSQQASAQKSTDQVVERTREVNEMLDRLFPQPQEVLSQEQMQQMQRNLRRQQQLGQKAQQLGQKMDELSQEVPLFGGDPKQSLENARGEMDRSVGQMQGGKLPSGAMHGRRAADELGKLRQQLEQASQGGKGGLPLPLGGQGSGGQREGGSTGPFQQKDIEIPQADKNRAAPRFRKELLEAAKQKAPEHYEDAVRRYYEELIK